MFDSVLDRGVVPRRRLATGAVISVLGHAAALTLVLLVRPPRPVEEVTKVIVWPTVPPMFTPAPAPGPAAAPAVAPARRTPRPDRPRELLVPAKVQPLPDTEPPPDLGPDKNPVVGTRVDTPKGPTGPGPAGPGGGGGPPDSNGSCVGDACPRFENGMTRPILVDRGREPTYTREAFEARVEGRMTIECVVTLAGRLEHCNVLQSVPHMERAVVEALMTRRYTPATRGGRQLAVRYVFNVKLELPR